MEEVDIKPFSISHRRMMLNEKINNHQALMAKNPYNPHYKRVTLSKDDPNYGKPPPGSLTEKRGKKAAAHINSEVVLLCDMIYQEGSKAEDGTAAITFGDLFQIYTRISNKVVGTLMRARKHGLLQFEGEMLFQRRDDDVIIQLIKPIKEIRDELAQDTEFEVGICHK